MKKLATGVLYWESEKCEHGMTFSFSLSGRKGQLKLKMKEKPGAHVQLIAEVKKVLGSLSPRGYESKFSNISVQIPKVGEKFVLCEGLLAVCRDSICYRPNGERGKTLLDLRALHILQGHEVTLYFKENPEN